MSFENKPFRATGGVCRFLLIFEGCSGQNRHYERDVMLRNAIQILRRHVVRAGRESELVAIGMPTPSGQVPVEATASLEPVLRCTPGVIDVLRD